MSRAAVERGSVRTVLAVVTAAASAAGVAAQARGTRLPDPAMAGAWTGEAQIVVSWTAQRRLPIRLVVAADGRVSGQVGDARLVDAHLRPNRGWFGRHLRVKTDYIVVGRLEGALIATEGIRRDGARLPLNWTGRDFRGGVHTTGAKAGGAERAALSASRLTLRRTTTAG